MAWFDDVIQSLAASPVCGYQAQATVGATEPSALAALALLGHGRIEPTLLVGDFLREIQTLPDGSVGVRKGEPLPRWTTSLAILTWHLLAQPRFAEPLTKAAKWALATEGQRIRDETHSMGHDTWLAAWPWADGTHSWLEPSALFVIALKAAGATKHARVREAVKLLVDRLLPEGGCNYGNTFVLRQKLRPHVQPTGIVLLALADETILDARIERSLEYLEREVNGDTTTASLAWALQALAAYDRRPAQADDWLDQAYERSKAEASPHKLALLALAKLGRNSPFVAVLKKRGDEP